MISAPKLGALLVAIWGSACSTPSSGLSDQGETTESVAGQSSDAEPESGGDDSSADPPAPEPTVGDPQPGAGGEPGDTPEADPEGTPAGPELGAFPVDPSPVTRGGTMTFLNIGAPGSWPRRLDRQAGDPACDYKDGEDTWGGHCCQSLHQVETDQLAPFDEEMTLILKAVEVKQLAVYQPMSAEPAVSWSRVTSWDARGERDNLWFTREGNGSLEFPGDLTGDDCVGYVMQEPSVDCGDEIDYFCPDDPGILHRGYTGSKLVVFLGSMDLDDAQVGACGGDGAGHPGPWVAFVASELVRDGGRKWNGLCNCYSQTGSVGDGCGEINVFEVVMDNNDFSNREFASTGVRSYQAGHVGGAVCGADCDRDSFAEDVDVVDACAQQSYAHGPEITAGGESDGCPVWRRPKGDRYFFILLDEQERAIQVGMIHPSAIPEAAEALLPALPFGLSRGSIDALLDMRLPE